MRFSVTVLALFALLAPQAAQAKSGTFAKRDALTHGVAGDERYVFVTEPGIGVAPNGARVVALDRFTGREVAALPAPEGGFKLPFTLRVPRTGHLVVLDSGGFPPVGPPVVYDYSYGAKHGFTAKLTRTVNFAGNPMGFAEDVDVLPNGEYVVSESIFGGLWIVGRDGAIRRGLVPDDGASALRKLGPCQDSGVARTVGDLPFAAPGGFLPGAGSLAVHGKTLYISSTCEGGIQELPIKVLLDSSKPAVERAEKIKTLTAKADGDLESLKGITFNRWDPKDDWIYAGDPFHLKLIRVNSRTGKREVLSDDSRRLDFTIAATFLPPVRHGAANPLITTSDQEYRWSPTNAALNGVDHFQLPFIMAEFYPKGRR
ncbi:hypothetical protein OM076_08080 [Solirubrobacter ginsenosidimutans]|uniref:Esterase-like activity of phytase family protein n=1 Tax=Solirubrobacter ginsenosidimutans TaxID=490573 RepID=A0A9X3S0L4_9ACTN|nr:hypothetical protein [Solirubrobacter ginsenosidimutans]MDA0160217.1 hypothetical protein [Solirubrobacter ginsenosidimutans]